MDETVAMAAGAHKGASEQWSTMLQLRQRRRLTAVLVTGQPHAICWEYVHPASQLHLDLADTC